MDPAQPAQSDDNSLALPEGDISHILGLLEILRHKNGKETISTLAAELQMDVGDTLSAVRGAEVLKLVHTTDGQVVLEPLGKKLIEADINDTKMILKEQMQKLPIFKKIVEYLNHEEDQEVYREEFLEKLAELLPNENAEDSFHAFVEWGRYSELFGYNDDSEMFYLDNEES